MEIRSKPQLRRVIRLDSMPINKASFTPEGFLMDTPILTCTGIFEYTNHDGSVRKELRLPEEVFSKESLESYEGSPIIISHDAGLITKDNVAENEIGTILTKGFKDGDNVRAKIVIHDTDEMKASGLKELSLGYNLDLDETPGSWNGQHYDAIQRNIRINHLALVREARAGEQARLNIDGKGSEISEMKGAKVMRYKKTTKARRSDGILSPDELKEAIKEYRARHPEAGQGANQDDEEETATPMPPVPEVEQKDADEPDQITETAEEIREKQQAKQDAEEDDLAQANETIAHQDEDIQTLLDIIDTLLAERDFKGAKQDAEEEPVPAAPEEEIPEKTDADEEEEEFPLPQEDGDDDEIPFTNEEENEDGDEECENEDDADDDIPSTDKAEAAAMNADSIDAIVRTRVKLGIVAEKLNLDGLENMSLKAAKKAVIKVVRPSINLDGKGDTYINAMFDMACDDVKSRARKDTRTQRKQMFNGDARRTFSKRGNTAEDARQRMIARRLKKNKEVE